MISTILLAAAIGCGARAFYLFVYEKLISKEFARHLIHIQDTAGRNMISIKQGGVTRKVVSTVDPARGNNMTFDIYLRHCKIVSYTTGQVEHLASQHFEEMLKYLQDNDDFPPERMVMSVTTVTKTGHVDFNPCNHITKLLEAEKRGDEQEVNNILDDLEKKKTMAVMNRANGFS